MGIWLFIRRKPLGAAAVAVLALIALAAVFAEAIAPHDPLVQDIPSRLRPPGRDFLFGTDGFGRDVFSRVVHGARPSLYVGVVSVAVGATVGAVLGLASAYNGGKADLLVQRVVDVLLAFPLLVLAVVMAVALGPSTNTLVIAIALALAPQTERLLRAHALTVKEETYVLAVRTLGAGSLRIMLGHVLPNSLGPALAHATGYFGTALAAESAVSFLGLGAPPPYPSWGRMIQEGARHYLEVAPWLTVFPGLVLSVTIVSFAFLGDALRDLLAPGALRAGSLRPGTGGPGVGDRSRGRAPVRRRRVGRSRRRGSVAFVGSLYAALVVGALTGAAQRARSRAARASR